MDTEISVDISHINIDKIYQYRQVLKLLEEIESLKFDPPDQLLTNACKDIIKLNVIAKKCTMFGISLRSLFTNISLDDFLKTYAKENNIPNNISPLDLLSNVTEYIVKNTHTHDGNLNSNLIVDAHRLLMKNFDTLKSEIGNYNIKQEIRLEKMKYETINQTQLKITARNTLATLIGVIFTALLTVANILISTLKDTPQQTK